MKIIAFLTLIIFSSLHVFSQEHSIIDIGVGYPIFFQRNFDKNSGGTHYIGHERINTFAELPELIRFRNNPDFSVFPGAGYSLFNEFESGGGLGGGNDRTLKHQAFSLYLKFNYSITENSARPFRWYAGLLSGVYVFSKTNGNVGWFRLEQNGYKGGNYSFDHNGKFFFNNFYNGLYAGFKINTGTCNWIQPGFELSFYPGYASITDKFLAFEDQHKSTTKSMMMLSVILGIGAKKSHPNQ